MRLNHKTILITGANRGIGRALAEALAKQPVNLLLGMRDPKSYQPIEQGQATSIKPIRLDLSSLETIQRDLKAAGDQIHEVDVLINNAGQFVAGPLEGQDLKKMADMVQSNLTGLMQLTAELLPVIRKRKGKIVNNASIVGYVWLPFDATYSATKAGVVAFSEALRRELTHTGVSVLHLVTPTIATDMLKDIQAIYPNGTKPVQPDVWAHRVVKAIEADKTMLTPGGTTGFARILSQGPRFLIDLVARQIKHP